MKKLIEERKENTKKIVEEMRRLEGIIRESESILDNNECDFDFEINMLESSLSMARLEKSMLEMRVHLDEFTILRGLKEVNK